MGWYDMAKDTKRVAEVVGDLIRQLQRLEGVERVELFGSYTIDPEKAHDIDIKIQGWNEALLDELKSLLGEVREVGLDFYISKAPGYQPLPPTLRSSPPKYIHVWLKPSDAQLFT